MNTDSRRDAKGLSTRHLFLIFLAGVAVCGVFFSLGFLVGYNERSAHGSPITERVTTPGAIPPTINAPLETVPVGPNSGPTSSSSVPLPVVNPPVNSPPSSPGGLRPDTSARGTASPPPLSARAEPEPNAPATSSAGTAAAGAGFIVQVTAMRAKQDAEALVRILRGHGYRVVLVAPQNAHAKDSLYRVQVGPFASRDSAEKTLAKLKHEGFKPFIRR